MGPKLTELTHYVRPITLEPVMVDTQPLKEGVKNDHGKLRYDLLPPEAMEEFALVYTIGANKYADRNWELGLSWGRIVGALLRHTFKWLSGEKRDPDGQHHMASVMWCAAALMTYEARGMDKFDDRKPIDGVNA